ncbi:MAG: hypothetical protein ACI8RZ_003317 [Myxococcota bacterium]|jgi:hypothetical protein
MADEEKNTTKSEDELRSALSRIQGSSRERLLNALAKYLADEERRREFLDKIRSI